MATVDITKVKIRRGTDSQRQQVILDQGELGYVTDFSSRRVFVGDGFTYGGFPVSTKLVVGSITTPTNFSTAQIGDLIYNTDNTSLYTLSGINSSGFPDYTNPAAYAYIGPQSDNLTLSLTNGTFSVNTVGISAVHISDSVFDYSNGFARTGNSSIRINYDNSTIKINGSNQLYVHPANINAALLPSLNPGPNKLWNNAGIVSVGF